MSKKTIRWLYGELPELVAQGVLTPDSADALRNHYGSAERPSGRRIALILCSILGASLIGLGIILLLGHNWDDLSRQVRAVISFTPLVAAQLLAAYVIWRRGESVPWREGTATFLMLSMAAAIALVGQTYHISGDPGAFVLSWMLPSVPIVYLLGASLPALIYLVGITSWAGIAQGDGGHALLFWPMLAVVVPHIVQAFRRDRHGVRSTVLCWGLCLCLCVATGVTLEKVWPGLWIIVYAGLFASMYLAGSLWQDDSLSDWQRPLQVVGAVGAVVLALMLTYDWPWDDIGWGYYRHGWRHHEWAAVADYVLAVGLLASTVSLLAIFMRRGERGKLFIGVAPALAAIGYTVSAFTADETVAMTLFNLYLLVLGVGTIATGIRSERLSLVNAGMAVVAGLILARFFDSDMPFLLRGIAFIILGTGFLVTNLVLLRRRGDAQ